MLRRHVGAYAGVGNYSRNRSVIDDCAAARREACVESHTSSREIRLLDQQRQLDRMLLRQRLRAKPLRASVKGRGASDTSAPTGNDRYLICDVEITTLLSHAKVAPAVTTFSDN